MTAYHHGRGLPRVASRAAERHNPLRDVLTSFIRNSAGPGLNIRSLSRPRPVGFRVTRKLVGTMLILCL
jgi:hypothetical protein